jgi:hypothetical protein
MYATAEAAKRIGVSKNTLLRWIAEGLMPDVDRDWRGWRTWSAQDIERAIAFCRAYHEAPVPRKKRRPPSKTEFAKAAATSMWRLGKARERSQPSAALCANGV